MRTLEAQILKLILLHNKLLTEQDVDVFLKLSSGAEDAVQRMVDDYLLSPNMANRVLSVYHRKLEKERARTGSHAAGSASAAAGGADADPPARQATAVAEKDGAETEEAEQVAAGVLGDAGPKRMVVIPSGEKVRIQADRSYADDSTAAVVAQQDDAGNMQSPVKPGDIDDLGMKVLSEGIRLGASDVHLTSGSPPFYRLHGELVFTDLPPLTARKAQRIVLGFMDAEQQQHYLRTHDLDFSFSLEGEGRFRVNALDEIRGPGIIFRIIPQQVPTLKMLDLPQSLVRFTEYHQGLVLVTGPAGCGKTTTAAALIDLINTARRDHIITVEDPVEFIHASRECNITHRQVPVHTRSFTTALKAALREDPDVIMIGEMRDLETMSLAIRAAETGHLVFGTLQTKSAMRTIDRVIDVFPEDQQAQIRAMLSESLRGVIAQHLVPRRDGRGRIVAVEVLFVNHAVSNLIRDGKTFQLPSVMQTGRKAGQRLMDDSLRELIKENLITQEAAAKVAENPKNFK